MTPNIDAIAHAGVRFRNVWSMPECSPSRAMFFEGRYPLRTNIFSAMLSTDLANSQVSPYEVTTPNLLRTVNYDSGPFGKFHLAGADTNPFEYASPHLPAGTTLTVFWKARRIRSIPPPAAVPYESALFLRIRALRLPLAAPTPAPATSPTTPAW